MKMNLFYIYATLCCLLANVLLLFSARLADKLAIHATMLVHKAEVKSGRKDFAFHLPMCVADVLVRVKFDDKNRAHHEEFNAVVRKSLKHWASDRHGLSEFEANLVTKVSNPFHLVAKARGWSWRTAAVDFLDYIEAVAMEFAGRDLK